MYDDAGKEVTADDVANGTKADGTAAANYYTDKATATRMEIAAGEAKKAFIASKPVNGTLNFNLHVGADSSSDNKIKVQIDEMSATGIGVKGLKVDTEDDATAAIDTISQAIQKVSTQRSNLGACSEPS